MRIVLVALGFAVASCSTAVDAVDVAASGDGETLHVAFASCNADLSVIVEESDDAIRVGATRARDPDRLLGGQDCLDGRTVRLEAPIGDRAVVDAHSGEALEVVYEPWNQTKYGVDEYRAALEAAAACYEAEDPDIATSIVESDGIPSLEVEFPDVPDGGSYRVPDCMGPVEPLTR